MVTRPTKSRQVNASFMHAVAMMPLKKTPTAPTGATSEVGAKPYARKLKSSPPAMSRMPSHQMGRFMTGVFSGPSSFSVWVCAYFCRFRASGITKFDVTAIDTPTMFWWVSSLYAVITSE